MSKRGTNKNERKLRRELEILKAQVKSQSGLSIKNAKIIEMSNTGNKVEVPLKSEEKYKLPVELIKKDLLKTVAFAAFALIVLVGLSLGKVSL